MTNKTRCITLALFNDFPLFLLAFHASGEHKEHMSRLEPQKFISGFGHQALNVKSFERSKKFYIETLGLKLLYEDAKHVFLKVGDNENFGILALLAKPEHPPDPIDPSLRKGNLYNHFGFRASTPEMVFEFADYLKSKQVEILKGPYQRSDGASVYFLDPDGYTLEYLYLNPDPSVYPKSN